MSVFFKLQCDAGGRRAIGCLLALCASIVAAGEPNPRERIDFWQNNYTTAAPDSDPQVARAHDIFQRLVRIAGRRPGVEPRLHVIVEDPVRSPLPVAIPDGWVVISRRVIDFCYRTPSRGDDRLAFVLAHEIAHHLENDFWHIKFFQALETYQKGSGDRRLLGEVREIAALTDKVLAKELRADELGMTYLVMAGFDPGAVLDSSGTGDFFHEWIRTIDPSRLGSRKARTHPEPSQRVATVQARLRQVSDQAELFNTGLMYYLAGDYARTIRALEEFRRYFPGREVHHNLGAAHYQLALQFRKPPIAGQDEPLFKLSVAVDPFTRANRQTRGAKDGAARDFDKHLAAAIEQYQTAISQDPRYVPSYRSLGAAHITRGEPYKAIAVLQDGLKLAPGDAALLNNLGVAFFYAGNTAEARRYLGRARDADSAHDAAWFNLAVLAHLLGNVDEAGRSWQEYRKRDSSNEWVTAAHRRYGFDAGGVEHTARFSEVSESIAGIEIGAYENEIPKGWGRPVSRKFQMEVLPTRVASYPNGVKAVFEGDELRLIAAMPSFTGATQRGIRLGNTRREVLQHYGTPNRVLATVTQENLIYPDRGIAFSLRDGRVASWLIFWD